MFRLFHLHAPTNSSRFIPASAGSRLMARNSLLGFSVGALLPQPAADRHQLPRWGDHSPHFLADRSGFLPPPHGLTAVFDRFLLVDLKGSGGAACR
jgi:hypothetical protein